MYIRTHPRLTRSQTFFLIIFFDLRLLHFVLLLVQIFSGYFMVCQNIDCIHIGGVRFIGFVGKKKKKKKKIKKKKKKKFKKKI